MSTIMRLALDPATTWFTSDLHLADPWAHKAFRRWHPDPQAFDEYVARRWDSSVREGNTVVVVGDVCGTAPTFGGSGESIWVLERPGRKFLVRGNWDTDAQVREMSRAFSGMADHLVIELGAGGFIDVNHYPTAKHLHPLVHGHTHKREKLSEAGVHVGWEAWQRLIRGTELLEWVGKWTEKYGPEPTSIS